MRLKAFQEAELRYGSAVAPAAGLAAVAAEHVFAPFAASVAGAAVPSAGFELHWRAVARLADAPAPAAVRASDAPLAAGRKASAAAPEHSGRPAHFQCLEPRAAGAAEGPSRG